MNPINASALILGVCALLVIVVILADERRIARDPYRVDTMDMSTSCDSAKHAECGFPSPLYFARAGVKRCRCRCHLEQA